MSFLSPPPLNPLSRPLPRPRPIQAQLTSSPSRELTGRDTQEISIAATCILGCWTMEAYHLPFTQKSFLFSCGTPLQYLVYWVLTVTIFSLLYNHNNRIKTSSFIHHIFLATFTTVLNTHFNKNVYNFPGSPEGPGNNIRVNCQVQRLTEPVNNVTSGFKKIVLMTRFLQLSGKLS